MCACHRQLCYVTGQHIGGVDCLDGYRWEDTCACMWMKNIVEVDCGELTRHESQNTQVTYLDSFCTSGNK